MLLLDSLFPQSQEDTVIIVAPGPSLDAEQIRLIERSEHFTITIGDAGRVALPYADILYHCDAKWWNHYEGCPEFKNCKISHEETKYTYKLLRSEQKYGLSLDFPKIVLGNNSGYQAINLAVFFKPKNIVLVGFDMQDSNGRHNIIGDHPKEVKRPSNFPLFIHNISSLVKPLEDLGITVYNCSNNSALECFKKKRLIDVI